MARKTDSDVISYFLKNMNKITFIYKNRHLGTTLFKISIPNNISSPLEYTRDIAYHANPKKIKHILLKIIFNDKRNDNEHSLQQEIDTHNIITYGTFRFWEPLCPVILEHYIYNTQTDGKIINRFLSKLMRPNISEHIHRIIETLKTKNFVCFSFMEYIDGFTINQDIYDSGTLYKQVNEPRYRKGRYLVNVYRYILLELALVGYIQEDAQQSNFMYYKYSGKKVHQTKKSLTPVSPTNLRSPRSPRSPRGSRLSFFRNVSSGEAKRMLNIKSTRKVDYGGITIDLQMVKPFHRGLKIDWSLEEIKNNLNKIPSNLFHDATSEDIIQIQEIKKMKVLKQLILEERGEIIPYDAIKNLPFSKIVNNNIKLVYEKYELSFQEGLKLLGPLNNNSVHSYSSRHIRSDTNSRRKLETSEY
jgi:hypothetical protein